jgi:hypothetical protein
MSARACIGPAAQRAAVWGLVQAHDLLHSHGSQVQAGPQGQAGPHGQEGTALGVVSFSVGVLIETLLVSRPVSATARADGTPRRFLTVDRSECLGTGRTKRERASAWLASHEVHERLFACALPLRRDAEAFEDPHVPAAPPQVRK